LCDIPFKVYGSRILQADNILVLHAKWREGGTAALGFEYYRHGKWRGKVIQFVWVVYSVL